MRPGSSFSTRAQFLKGTICSRESPNAGIHAPWSARNIIIVFFMASSATHRSCCRLPFAQQLVQSNIYQDNARKGWQSDQESGYYPFHGLHHLVVESTLHSRFQKERFSCGSLDRSGMGSSLSSCRRFCLQSACAHRRRNPRQKVARHKLVRPSGSRSALCRQMSWFCRCRLNIHPAKWRFIGAPAPPVVKK